jgi:hypothetical protein
LYNINGVGFKSTPNNYEGENIILLFLLITQIEDPIDPSCRLKGMSWDFTYLIEDTITDVQLFPARIMQWSKPSIYLKSYWSDIEPGSHFVTGLFYPSLFSTFGVGVMYDYDVYNQSTFDSNGICVQKLRFNEQHPSLVIGRPFLKNGGFLALKLSYIYDNDLFNNNSYFSFDTFFIIDIDSITQHWRRHLAENDNHKIPQWRFLLNQFLPFAYTSAIDFCLEVCQYQRHDNSYDTMYIVENDTTIIDFSTLRIIRTLTSDHKDIDYSILDKHLTTGYLTTMYNIKPTWGQLRFLGRTGLTKGWAESEYGLVSHNVIIDKSDYFYPDTHYVYTDTITGYDTSYHAIHQDQIRYSAIAGIGGTFPLKNENILVGLKLGYFLDRFKQTSDSMPFYIQWYNASISLGCEWDIFNFLCLRDGLNLAFLYQFNEIDIACDGAFGIGLKPTSHFQMDFCSNLDIDDLFQSWEMDVTYNF